MTQLLLFFYGKLPLISGCRFDGITAAPYEVEHAVVAKHTCVRQDLPFCPALGPTAYCIEGAENT